MAKVFVWVGNPKSTSLSHGLADTYVEHLAEHHEVRRMDLSEMDFEPNLSQGYGPRQDLEACLQEWQENLQWCDHTAWFYPYWWGGMPAKMKGVFDRALLPGFGFKYHKKGPFWDRLLTGRTADVFITADSPSWYDSIKRGAPGRRQVNEMILKFVGIKPRVVRHFGIVKTASERKIRSWQKKAAASAAHLG